jgi:hypothetical protein
MPLAKEIEFPLFHRGLHTSNDGSKVVFTEEKLRQMERNSNFITRAGLLHAPIKYDHPAYGAGDKENHGKMVRYEYRNGSLHAIGTNWSDRIVEDKKRGARIAYSGEYVEDFQYPDPNTGKSISIGPAVVGLAVLGSTRPAIKALKPFEQFEFAEGESRAEVFATLEELRKSGLVAEDCEGTKFFGEVENDVRRFAEEEKTMPELTAADVARIVADEGAKIRADIDTKISKMASETESKIKEMSEESAEKRKRTELADSLDKEIPLGKIPAQRRREAILNPTFETVRSFAESVGSVLLPADEAGKGKGADGEGDGKDEPKALAALKPRHFSEMSGDNEKLVLAGLQAVRESEPDFFKGIESNQIAQIDRLHSRIRLRDLGTA